MKVRGLNLRGFEPRLNLAALEPHWHGMRVWWTGRSLREQVLLGSLLVVAIVALLLATVIAPLRAANADALAEIRSAGLLEARLRAGGIGLAARGRIRKGNASAIITDSAAGARIMIQRIEPDGANTRVVLADAPFDQVLRWIADLEQTSRLRVEQANLERKGSAGVVSATLVIAG